MNHPHRFCRLIPNYFAPKWRSESFSPNVNLHAIIHANCNFRCSFCNYDSRDKSLFDHYTDQAFEKRVNELMKRGAFFKFTGGEPTLCPTLLQDTMLIKQLGGHVFLDTNGSRPEVVQEICEANCVDVLGVSLKGLDCGTAASTSGVTNNVLCWENVFRTMQIAEEAEVDFIVTMVFHSAVPISGISEFGNLLKRFKRAHMKVNNLLDGSFQGGAATKTDSDLLLLAVKKYVKDNPAWAGRVTLVNDNAAVSNPSQVLFL